MDRDELKARCLALPGASEEFPFGDEVSVYRTMMTVYRAPLLPDGRRSTDRHAWR